MTTASSCKPRTRSKAHRHLWFGIFVITVLVGCGLEKRPAPQGFGLPVMDLWLDSEDLGRLNGHYKDKVPVPFEGTFEGQDLHGGLHYAGRTTQDAYKKNLHLTFAEGGTLNGLSHYRLGAQAADPTALRTMIGLEVYKAAGLPVPKADYCVVYLNGELLGLYLMIEPIDMDFFARRGLGSHSIYKAHHNDRPVNAELLAAPGQAFSIKTPAPRDEDMSDLRRMLSAVIDGRPEELEETLELESLSRYVAASAVLDNWDGFSNNYVIYNLESDPRFRFVPWDLDSVLSREGVVGPYGVDGVPTDVLARPELRPAHDRIMKDILDTLGAMDLTSRLTDLAAKIGPAYRADRTLAASDIDLERHARDLAEHLTRNLERFSAAAGTE